MSDGAISQDEIDALLSGVPIDGLNASGQVTNGPSVNIDAVALGKFADELKQPFADNIKKMTGVDCTAQNVVVEASVRDQLLAKLPEMVIAVMADFSNALTGDHIYIISTEFAQKLVSLINKEENAALDDMSLSIISETLSTHTNDEITALDKTQKFAGLACNPAEAVNMPKAMVRIPQNTFALFTYPVTLDGTPYTIWEAIAGEAAVQIGKAYGADDGGAGALSAADMASMQSLAGGMPMGGQPQMGMPNMGMPNMGMGQPMMNGMMGMPQMGGGMPMNTPNVQTLQYPNLQGGMPGGEQGNISLIMDVFMEMTVELGRTKKQIRDILGMGEGTIIELDKLAGEPVDILVNHKPIAKGEVVVIDENFGVRVTEILSPLERVTDLH
ncbi:flagellar motor switch protein FliN [Treponema sp.]|uniref:flagellar motor switch protein FliN n=1 Tax=Treponema sp. TaxID=166 RepID=UPI00298EA9FC|nr:flagellar motor switch protein FliN [Treponema sp.]